MLSQGKTHSIQHHYLNYAFEPCILNSWISSQENLSQAVQIPIFIMKSSVSAVLHRSPGSETPNSLYQCSCSRIVRLGSLSILRLSLCSTLSSPVLLPMLQNYFITWLVILTFFLIDNLIKYFLCEGDFLLLEDLWFVVIVILSLSVRLKLFSHSLVKYNL